MSRTPLWAHGVPAGWQREGPPAASPGSAAGGAPSRRRWVRTEELSEARDCRRPCTALARAWRDHHLPGRHCTRGPLASPFLPKGAPHPKFPHMSWLRLGLGPSLLGPGALVPHWGLPAGQRQRGLQPNLGQLVPVLPKELGDAAPLGAAGQVEPARAPLLPAGDGGPLLAADAAALRRAQQPCQ